ncbi:NADP-dependent oxidoreductase [Actinomycetospora sp. NBRC 106378]|uniref:MDR family NADP-dependent oxidoreductase n=1 Tax=Actinomycetospora sp. NBRC 106378 TaxID=3032208 RepID=UPI0024A60ACF|nr:NADP-dependent oxidoreductase [Actinomycetospora sp. NBRC 106378]GLZ55389.1 NADP-dependent oxidoreductase [Actinomycetospora sp. NBRC 106378]
MSESVPERTREVRLRRYLEHDLTDDLFETVEIDLPVGEVVVRQEYLHVAAAFGDLMREGCDLPMPPYRPGSRIGGGAVGTVVRSSSAELPVGELVVSFDGWAEYAAGPAARFTPVGRGMFPSPAYYLGQGPTAFHGMVDVARVGPGDVVFVSGAAGGVGSLAGQIARCRGASRVIGSAGSPAKVRYLVEELGFDAAFDYHDGPVVDRLRELAPDGVSVFFDNVGGEQFEAALAVAAHGARFALCGALASQIDGKDGLPRLDVLTAITRGVELRPFACYHLPEQIAAWFTHFGTWLGEGRFTYPHTVVEGGLDAAPTTLVGLLRGDFTGNVTVRL